jgi:hypothetical protein
VAQWNTTHQLIQEYTGSAIYDRISYDPNSIAKYSVSISSGSRRIAGITIDLPPKTPLAEAEQEALSELPPDARLIWTVDTLPDCLGEEYSSVIAAPVLPSGDIYLNFESGQDYPAVFDSTNVNTVNVRAGTGSEITDYTC